ncbi:MAG: polysaccharide deacetylase family protein, partial [Planctomycetota bacterium]
MVDRLALKVDVDTLEGLQKGVPALLPLFERQGVQATFFLSFGPDQSGRAVRRVLRPGFLKKMVRTRAVQMYGLQTMLRGTLLPSRRIAADSPELVREIEAAGHEVGIHAWNHALWQDRLPRMTRSQIESELAQAIDAFEACLGHSAHACAAPAWMVTKDSLSVQDDLALDYCSDTRGAVPFLPKVGDRVFRTMQIPTTLPTLDEVLGRGGVDRTRYNEYLMERMQAPVEVHTIHAEAEGRAYLDLLDDLLERLRAKGRKVIPLASLAMSVRREELAVHELVLEEIPGRAGAVSLQGAGVAVG